METTTRTDGKVRQQRKVCLLCDKVTNETTQKLEISKGSPE
ncbi:uncharacterized protein G2W53_025176 [Senna tora]|uniref:Uncharacterized protein n=1 Tax=Senna tora TaxID=362788 RepID=A0A834TEM6_9FABA|nr:uncharacterized protein G2W53_025176 [Senna tora]